MENRRRVEEEYMKNRVHYRPDILRQKADPAAIDGDKFTSKPENKDLELKLMENRRRVEEEYRKNRVHYRPDILRQKANPAAVDGDKFTSKPGNKRKATAVTASGRKRKVNDAPTSKPGTSFCNAYGHHFVFLIEFASGYALFDAHGMYEYPGFTTTFKIAEKYLNNNPFTLRAFYPFLSVGDALIQMKAICNSTVTKELKNFVVDNIPERISDYWIAVANARLAQTIGLATGIPAIAGHIIDEVMRGLRVKFDKFITGLELENMKMARLNLACSYRRQSCAHKESSMVQRIFYTVDKVVVVPHKFEGLFITKGLGKKNFICTKNLVPGKVLYGEKLISVENEDDGTEVEYRVWNPHLSKLAAAVMGGLTNIWVKPGSHVLYLGDVCGITVLQLSDLVGSMLLQTRWGRGQTL
ncbi:uncharacterized protein LOC135146799 isoform X1 [Daucus carota subsp. sativus]|uniref:uncharacterized protein LOC135146799 isoform X1 n=1 Tax=Daucus carota subsp. sativus TaxID=79200 RepID=UPI0030836566